MTPMDAARQHKMPLIQRMYGVRSPDGSNNGALQHRWIISDLLKAMIVLLMGAGFAGGCDAYKWYIKNKDVPQAFAAHCTEQAKTDKDLAGTLGRIEEGIKEIQRRR